MSELVAYAGATLLGVATLPQAAKLLRQRRADDFGWAFTLLNVAGLAMLAMRALVIEEWAFFAINALTTAFWGLAVGVKFTSARGGARSHVVGRASAAGPSARVSPHTEPFEPRRDTTAARIHVRRV